MAEPPKPPTSAERRAEADATAGAAQREATALKAQESRRRADRLLQGATDARFDALSEEDPQLTPEDRRRILRSLAGKEPPRRVIPGGTASRLALIRSRLRYRSVAVACVGLVVLGTIYGLFVARSNTPIGVVLSNAPQSVPIAFRLKNGQIVFDTLEPDTPYALVRQENGVAVLRRWVPGVGYAEAQVSVDVVHLR
jgi:hypothetical protein